MISDVLVGRADNPAVYVKPVTYHRVHGHPPQESDSKNARSGTFCGKRSQPPKPGAPGFSGDRSVARHG
jgi:hypothetical protein